MSWSSPVLLGQANTPVANLIGLTERNPATRTRHQMHNTSHLISRQVSRLPGLLLALAAYSPNIDGRLQVNNISYSVFAVPITCTSASDSGLVSASCTRT